MAVTSFSTGQIKQKVANTVDHAARSPEYFGRLVLIYSTLMVILIPDLLALLRLLMDIFEPVVEVDALSIIFEGMVLVLVYFFGVVIVLAATANFPELEYVVVMLALAMVMISGVVLGKVSNSCIPDGDCDGGKFFISMLIVTGAALTGYLLMLGIRRSTPWMSIVFLAVAAWTAELWLFQAFSSHGIRPTGGALAGAVCLVYAILWIAIFARMPKLSAEKRLPEPKSKW